MKEQKFDLTNVDASDIAALLYIESKGEGAYAEKIAFLLHLAERCGSDLSSVPASDAFSLAVKFYQALIRHISPKQRILSGEYVADED
jgi:hypothetical protein